MADDFSETCSGIFIISTDKVICREKYIDIKMLKAILKNIREKQNATSSCQGGGQVKLLIDVYYTISLLYITNTRTNNYYTRIYVTIRDYT